MTALLERERHGTGQSVSTSALGAQIFIQSWGDTAMHSDWRTLAASRKLYAKY